MTEPDERPEPMTDVILVAMMPLHRAAYEAWLAQHRLAIGRMPMPDFPAPHDVIPVYIITPMDMIAPCPFCGGVEEHDEGCKAMVTEDMPVLDFTLELLRQTDAPSVEVELEIPGEMWMGEATDERWGFHIGQQVLVNVHTPDKCAGRNCVLHNPSDHHMRDWPLLWRGDRGIMERRCPHGIGHPDPDDLAYHKSIQSDISVHSCDGCCRA